MAGLCSLGPKQDLGSARIHSLTVGILSGSSLSLLEAVSVLPRRIRVEVVDERENACDWISR
jgi:hypothetical protein